MTSAPAPVTLRHWLAQHPDTEIRVVSPHLDDAVLSTHALLSRAASRCTVTTVFTEAPADADPAWARATGFRDPDEEHAARRQEDQRALEHLGVAWRHVGARPDSWGDNEAAALARSLAGLSHPVAAVPAAATLVLLPAGAGAALSPWQRRLRRLWRKPAGAPAHAEHRLVRDRLTEALRREGVPVGYYAEHPYLWADAPERLARELQGLSPRPLVRVDAPADAPAKLEAARRYASQLVPILGARVEWQLKVLGLPELYFMPAD